MSSLWWARKEQLDKDQIRLIENLPLREDFLVLGPPGCGKTNVLLRRAQFVRGQNMSNVLVLTFTRSLTEFIKTGCFDAQVREIFPQSCVTTLESWQRSLYKQHKKALPSPLADLKEWKRELALGACALVKKGRRPIYDALFVDEAQDLLPEEVDLIANWSRVRFFVGDDRQRIYTDIDGLRAVRDIVPSSNERLLRFHYRVAPDICRMADRILLPSSGTPLASTAQYNGPTPAKITIHRQALSKNEQLEITAAKLKEQIRVYDGLVQQGDRLGVIVARTVDRDIVFDYLQNDPALRGKAKIIKSRGENDDDYDPSFDLDTPICILTVKGCKGLEFRALHWLFADELRQYHNAEHYYTVVTRAKTSLDICYTNELPQELALAHSETGVPSWE